MSIVRIMIFTLVFLVVFSILFKILSRLRQFFFPSKPTKRLSRPHNWPPPPPRKRKKHPKPEYCDGPGEYEFTKEWCIVRNTNSRDNWYATEWSCDGNIPIAKHGYTIHSCRNEHEARKLVVEMNRAIKEERDDLDANIKEYRKRQAPVVDRFAIPKGEEIVQNTELNVNTNLFD